MSEMTERKYDENNNEIHTKDNEGYEFWREYDENNNEIYFRNIRGVMRR